MLLNTTGVGIQGRRGWFVVYWERDNRQWEITSAFETKIDAVTAAERIVEAKGVTAYVVKVQGKIEPKQAA